MNMKQQNLKKTVLAVMTTALLAGCSADEQDSGGGGGQLTGVRLSGTIVDGYVAGAVVYVDFNENNRLDASESQYWAITDKDGRLGTSKDGTVNYCTSQPRHCITGAFNPNTEVMVRMKGGVDIATGDLFQGTMSAKVNVTADGQLDFVGSPLSSLLAVMTDDEKQSFADDLGSGITVDDLNKDFLGDSTIATDITKKTKLVQAAQTVQRYANSIGEALKEQHSTEKDIDSVDPSAYVFGAVVSDLRVQQQTNSSATLLGVLEDPASARNIVETTNNSLIDDLFGSDSTVTTLPTTIELDQKKTTTLANLVDTTGTNGLDDALAQVAVATRTIMTDTSVNDDATLDAALATIGVVQQLADQRNGVADTNVASVNTAITTIQNNFTPTGTFADFVKDSGDSQLIADALIGGETNLDTIATSQANRPKFLTFDTTAQEYTIIGKRLAFRDPLKPSDRFTLNFLADSSSGTKEYVLVACSSYLDTNSNGTEVTYNGAYQGSFDVLNDWEMMLYLNVIGTEDSGYIKSKKIENDLWTVGYTFKGDSGDYTISPASGSTGTTAADFIEDIPSTAYTAGSTIDKTLICSDF